MTSRMTPHTPLSGNGVAGSARDKPGHARPRQGPRQDRTGQDWTGLDWTGEVKNRSCMDGRHSHGVTRVSVGIEAFAAVQCPQIRNSQIGTGTAKQGDWELQCGCGGGFAPAWPDASNIIMPCHQAISLLDVFLFPTHRGDPEGRRITCVHM